tara:strand:+ start:92 stop:427 length:336 start_codon:yes stop_codon:yes gene_type:complete
MSSRYKNRRLATNSERMYDKVFKKKGVKSIIQYPTPVFKRPTQEKLDSLICQSYLWTAGDRYWALADKFYGDRNYWYIIARYNNKPTEAHISEGEEIKIPLNLGQAIEVLG